MDSPTPTTTVAEEQRPSTVRIRAVAEDTLAYAAARNYTGWDYADGMSSRLLERLPFESRWVNLAVQETVKRSPVNVRPLFLVEQRRSFKGTALFVLAHRYLDALPVDGGRVDHAARARELSDWLVENSCPGYSGFCGGHRHENQHLDHKTTPEEPDVVATAYGVQALLSAGEDDPSYAETARTAEEFLVEDMRYREVDGTARIDYYPKDTADHHTLNATALAARTFLDIYDRFGGDDRLERARRLLDFVVAHQTDRGGWYYREPSDSSHLSMDTHHNGFVVECLLRYAEVVDDGRYETALSDGLSFLRDSLFEPDGAPNWDESSAYPRDIHAAAQGIVVFAAADEPAFARRIIGWTLDNLYAGDGRFWFRRQRLYTRRITLMRWCEAWMSYALATSLILPAIRSSR